MKVSAEVGEVKMPAGSIIGHRIAPYARLPLPELRDRISSPYAQSREC